MKIEFEVDDIPPKKDGSKSMWAKECEAKKIVSLRKRAIEKIKSENVDIPISNRLKLKICIYLPNEKLETTGDLDNFITGICDALQKVHGNVNKWDKIFDQPENDDINPTISIISNDSKIISIIAMKKEANKENTHYKIVIQS